MPEFPGSSSRQNATVEPTMSSSSAKSAKTAKTAKTVNRLLWTAQGLTAALFLFAGSMKFIIPAEKMQQGPIVLPLAFLYFIGICEVLGAFGLLLPSLLRIRTSLTPLAAAGLTLIMIGATTISVLAMGVAAGILPAVVGLVTTFIAYGRTRIVSIENARTHSLHVVSA